VTTGNSGNSGSCGVNEGFLKNENKYLKFYKKMVYFTVHEFHSLILVEIVFLMHAMFPMVSV
jgi:hypothetical protein